MKIATYLKITRFVDDNLTDLVYDWNNQRVSVVMEKLITMINDHNITFQVNPLTLKELLLDALVHDYIQKQMNA